jgi:hypothetical protein
MTRLCQHNQILTICLNFDFRLEHLGVGIGSGTEVVAGHCIGQRGNDEHQLFAVQSLGVDDWLGSRSRRQSGDSLVGLLVNTKCVYVMRKKKKQKLVNHSSKHQNKHASRF